MHDLILAALSASENDFDWGGLAVPVVAGFLGIVIAIYNTRGETAALRRLRAMNDVIEKLPKDTAVLVEFTAARDLLAKRVALRMTDRRSLVRRVPPWVLGLCGTLIAVAAFLVAFQFAPPVISGFELAANVFSASLVFGALFTTAVHGVAIWADQRRLERDSATRSSGRGR